MRILETPPQEVHAAIDRLMQESPKGTRLDANETCPGYVMTWRSTIERKGGLILVTQQWDRFARTVSHVLALRRGELVLPLPLLRDLRKPAQRQYRQSIHIAR